MMYLEVPVKAEQLRRRMRMISRQMDEEEDRTVYSLLQGAYALLMNELADELEHVVKF